MQTGKWVTAWASVIGTSHSTENLPCQDFSTVMVLQESDIVISVIADGAGSCEHSHIGAQKAVEIVSELVKQRLLSNNWVAKEKHPEPLKWRREMFYVFKAAKAILKKLASEMSISFKSLSSTLCVVVSNGNWIASAHVGDSRSAWRDTFGVWNALITPQKGEEVNATLFLTSDEWEESLFSPWFETVVVQAEITALAVLTDGCERASFEMSKYDEELQKYTDPNKPHEPFFEPNYKNLIKMSQRRLSQDAINLLWTEFLTRGNKVLEKETDDKTMILSVFIPDKPEV